MTSPSRDLLQQLLTDTARRSPQALAVLSGDLALTYAELDRLSNRVARALLAHGVARGDRVGILARKSPASIVAVFGAVKCGACYVPLDTQSPDERLRHIMRDSGITAVLADRGTAGHALELSRETSPQLVVIVSDPHPEDARASSAIGAHPAEARAVPLRGPRVIPWAAVASESDDPVPSGDATAEDLAYVLYTSGSTGAPKGVMISHRASLTFVEWAAACAGLRPDDRVCSPAPLHFDLSVFDIFASCSAGACTVVVPPLTSMFPVRMAEWIQRQEVSVWYSVPSVLTMLASHGNLRAFDLSCLRAVIFAGEVFPAKYLSMLMEQLPDARHLNWYGPTETNVCTWYEVPRGGGPHTAPVPIGKPCENIEAFAVTAEGRRATVAGEEGELFVRGPGLMSGYWGQPQMTREALVADPLGRADGGPAYRTGDIVSLDEHGDFVFRGRLDGMVKTRGYRVELGEVEAVLYEHPSVREAAVLPLPDELLGNRLRAVICAEPPLRREDLLEHCRRQLPAYMVPDVIEFSGALPKTSTGKIDRVLLRSG